MRVKKMKVVFWCALSLLWTSAIGQETRFVFKDKEGDVIRDTAEVWINEVTGNYTMGNSMHRYVSLADTLNIPCTASEMLNVEVAPKGMIDDLFETDLRTLTCDGQIHEVVLRLVRDAAPMGEACTARRVPRWRQARRKQRQMMADRKLLLSLPHRAELTARQVMRIERGHDIYRYLRRAWEGGYELVSTCGGESCDSIRYHILKNDKVVRVEVLYKKWDKGLVENLLTNLYYMDGNVQGQKWWHDFSSEEYEAHRLSYRRHRWHSLFISKEGQHYVVNCMKYLEIQ